MTKAQDNLALWDQVSITPSEWLVPYKPGSHLSKVDNPYRTIKLATERWGPVGVGWGWEVEQMSIQDGYVWMRGYVWHSGSRDNKVPWVNNWSLGGDAAKACLTNAIVKALSYLGYHADIYMGKASHMDKPKPEPIKLKSKAARRRAVKEFEDSFADIFEKGPAKTSQLDALEELAKQYYEAGKLDPAEFKYVKLRILLAAGNMAEYDAKLEQHGATLYAEHLRTLDTLVQAEEVL